jgi:decaprenylphospho-beta-D-erythro-pentofuranosid-2-ulose 2-reductase
MSETIVIFGATSAMAKQTARLYAAEGAVLGLVGRDAERLEALAQDLRLRGAEKVACFAGFDAAEASTLSRTVDAVWEMFETVDTVLVAYGSLPDQADTESDPAALRAALDVNFISVAEVCHRVAMKLEARGSGTLAVIGSVAGLRGRQSNYVYGAAKGGLGLFLQGMRNRLCPKGIRVVTILPGFVDTPMTADIEKGPLFVSAEKAGRIIHKALKKNRKDVVYVPGFWWAIMLIIRMIPEPVFKKLKL